MSNLKGWIAGITVSLFALLVLGPAAASAAPVAELTPASHAFGEQTVDTESAHHDFTFANVGDGDLTIVSVAKGGTNPGQFNLKPATNCAPGIVLNADDSQCRIRVTFDPGSLGAKSATIEVVTDLSPTPVTAAVTGTSVPVAAVRAAVSSIAIPFDNQAIGDGPSIARTLELSSRGSLPLNVGPITVTGTDATQFPVDPAACQNRTLTQNQTCPITVTFDPDTAGPKRAQISIPTNAPGSPTVVSLAGTGTAPPPPPSPPKVGIKRNLPRVAGRTVKVPLTCAPGDAAACAGEMTLKVRGSALGKKGKQKRRWFTVGRRAYSSTGDGKSVPVKLKGFASKALHKRGRLPLSITVTVKQPPLALARQSFNRTAKAKAKKPSRS